MTHQIPDPAFYAGPYLTEAERARIGRLPAEKRSAAIAALARASGRHAPADPHTPSTLVELHDLEQIECRLVAEQRRPTAPIVQLLPLAPGAANLAHFGSVDVAGSDSTVMRPLKREEVLGIALRADGKIYPVRASDVEPVFTGNVNMQVADLELGDADAARESDAEEAAQSARAQLAYDRRMAAQEHELSAIEYEAREAARAETN